MKVVAAAPGKLMLLGEHSVVYGYPCLSAALDTYLTISVEQAPQDIFDIPANENPLLLSNILAIVRRHCGKTIPLHIATDDILSGYGIGSSSAITVAAIIAMSTVYSYTLSDNEVFTLGLEAMRTLQPKASGYDIATCISGGTIFYDSFANTFTRLETGRLPLVIGFSGTKASTPSLVDYVSRKYADAPERVESLFIEIRSLVLAAQQAIQTHQWSVLGQLMTKNHKILQSLSVSTPILDIMVEAAIAEGAYGAKLSGAGGGDCMIAVVPDSQRQQVIRAIEQTGGRVLDISVGTGKSVYSNVL